MLKVTELVEGRAGLWASSCSPRHQCPSCNVAAPGQVLDKHRLKDRKEAREEKEEYWEKSKDSKKKEILEYFEAVNWWKIRKTGLGSRA